MNEEVKNPPEILVRRMRDGEEEGVKALAGRTFPPLGSVLFSPSPHVLVAEWDGRLVGAVVPETVVLPDKRRGGLMLWLMTDPGTRGFGVGGRLVEAALRFFEERGCREVFACVEGFNTSSSRLFATRGFTILSFGEQLRRYGPLGTLALWLRTHRFGGDVGHFLWARPGATKSDSPALQWWVGTFASALVFLLVGWRNGLIGGLGAASVLGGIVVVVALFGLREAVMRLAARLQGLPVRHRAWEAAFPLSFGIAAAFGVFLPAPGSVYPRGSAWRYRDLVPKLGLTALAGASVVLVFAWAAWALLRFGSLPPEVAAWLHAAQTAGLSLAIIEVLFPFSPFASFSGRRVWDWNRPMWGVLAVAAVALFLVAL